MNLFAIGDLHLAGGQDKPMAVFGPRWDRHFEKISQRWREQVAEEDVVLIPGDISWAMTLSDAVADLRAIGELPGRKVLIRGNHDYWWSGIGKVRSALPPGMTALQQDAADMGDFVVCGTRGWMIPSEEAALGEQDEKIYRRELARLDLALDAAKRVGGRKPIVVMLHYPPLYKSTLRSGFTERMEAAGVRLCVYGHLHGIGIAAGFSGEQGGVRYELTSCDSQGFAPRNINFF